MHTSDDINLYKEYENIITEGKIAGSVKVSKYLSAPMFTVLVKNSVDKDELQKLSKPRFEKALINARHQIHELGFPSMHSYIIIDDLSGHVNKNTGKRGDVAGYAYKSKKIIEVNLGTLLRYQTLDMQNETIKLVVHEWAHNWMYNQSKEFKASIKRFYRELLRNVQQTDFVKNSDFTTWKYQNNKIYLDVIGYFKNKLSSLLDERTIKEYPVNIYISQKYGLNKDTIQYFTGGINIKAKLKTQILATDSWGNSEIVKPGEIVVLSKYHEFIIDYYPPDDPNHRYGMVLYDKVLKDKPLETWVETIGGSDIYAAFENTLNIYNQHQPEYPIKQKILELFRDIFVGLCNKYNLPKIEEYNKLIEQYSEYVFKRYIDILNDPNFKYGMHDSQSQKYEKLWVLNDYKPDGVSLGNFILEQIYNQQHTTFHKQRNLSGKEFEALRQILQKIYSWVNSYGMSNEDELWATAIEGFFDLPKKYQKKIISYI